MARITYISLLPRGSKLPFRVSRSSVRSADGPDGIWVGVGFGVAIKDTTSGRGEGLAVAADADQGDGMGLSVASDAGRALAAAFERVGSALAS